MENRSLESAYCQRLKRSSYLTPRETDLLKLLATGRSFHQAAKIMKISKRTAEQYGKYLRLKFNCKNKFELIEIVRNKGFLDLNN